MVDAAVVQVVVRTAVRCVRGGWRRVPSEPLVDVLVHYLHGARVARSAVGSLFARLAAAPANASPWRYNVCAGPLRVERTSIALSTPDVVLPRTSSTTSALSILTFSVQFSQLHFSSARFARIRNKSAHSFFSRPTIFRRRAVCDLRDVDVRSVLYIIDDNHVKLEMRGKA